MQWTPGWSVSSVCKGPGSTPLLHTGSAAYRRYKFAPEPPFRAVEILDTFLGDGASVLRQVVEIKSELVSGPFFAYEEAIPRFLRNSDHGTQT